jgi:transcriptional regulator GlxA family with amidase domain
VIGGDPRYAGLLDPDPPGGFCRRLEASGAAFLDRLCHDLSEADSGAATRFNAGQRCLAWDRFSSAGALDGTALHPGLEQAVALLARQPSADIPAVVAASGLTRWHLARLFRSELGTTLTAWRSRVRVERALALHRQRPRAGWLELGLEAGSGSYAQFHRAFTSHTGFGPRRWQGTSDAVR